MCRIAYIPDPCQWPVEVITALYTDLDNKGGGSGIGIGWLTREGMARISKSVRLTPTEAARLTKELEGDTLNGVLFHTRIPSVGVKCDNLCMPFTVGDNALMVFNGTWKDWKAAFYALIGRGVELPPPPFVSDTLVAARLLEELGIEYLGLIDTGVTVLMTPNGVFLTKTFASDDFAMGRTPDNKTLFASRISIGFELEVQEVKAVEYLDLTCPLSPDMLVKHKTGKLITHQWYSPYPSPGPSAPQQVPTHQLPKGTQNSTGGSENRQTKAEKKTKTEKKQAKKNKNRPKEENNPATSRRAWKEIVRLAVKPALENGKGPRFHEIPWEHILSYAALEEFSDVYVVYVDCGDHPTAYLGIMSLEVTGMVLLDEVQRFKTEQALLVPATRWNTDEVDIWFRDTDWNLPIWIKVSGIAQYDFRRPHYFTARVGLLSLDETGEYLESGCVYSAKGEPAVTVEIGGEWRDSIPLSSLQSEGVGSPNEWLPLGLITDLHQMPLVEGNVQDNFYFLDGEEKIYLMTPWSSRERNEATTEEVVAESPTRALWECQRCKDLVSNLYETCPSCKEPGRWKIYKPDDESSSELVVAKQVPLLLPPPEPEGECWVCGSCQTMYESSTVPEVCLLCGERDVFLTLEDIVARYG